MATKVDSSSTETYHGQSTVSTSTSSIFSTPKVSIFGAKAKSGFLIPKNKLSGSLVPKFRGGAKTEGSNTMKEENTRQVQRKTKWGPDLTQDATVRKGRALAYQTRLEQITELMKSGALDTQNNQGSQSLEAALNNDYISHSIKSEAFDCELLELERREVIGEILRLNPSYKVPADYKPLLKEAKVPIPTKEHSGQKFIALLLGPGSNTQKRLEEETGAKVQIHGVKRDTREKCEITLSNLSEVDGAYEDLYISVSADTFEKVDAAVQLIELLLTPISGNNAAVASVVSTSGPGGDVTTIDSNQKDITSNYMTAGLPVDVNQGAVQPMMANAQQQFPTYAAPWYPIAYPQPSSGFIPTSVPNNTMPYPASPVGPFRAPPYSGQAPQYGSIQGNSTPFAFRPLVPMQNMQQPLTQMAPPQSPSGQQPSLLYPSSVPQPGSTVPNLAAPQPIPAGLLPASRPAMPLSSQLASGPFPNRPWSAPSPLGSSGWPSASQVVPPTQRPAFPHSSTPPLRSNPVISAPAIASVTPQIVQSSAVVRPPVAMNPLSVQLNIHPNIPSRPPAANFALPPAANFALPPASPSRPTLTAVFPSMPPQSGPFASPAILPLPSGAPVVGSLPATTPRPPFLTSPAPRPLPMPAGPARGRGAPAVPHNMLLLGVSNPILTQASASSHPLNAVIGRLPVPAQSLTSVQAPRPDQAKLVPQERPPNPGNMPCFPPATQATASNTTPATVPKLLRPISGDFTFQPLRAQIAVTLTPANSQSVKQMTVPLAAPQPPSFRPALQNPAPSVNNQGFPRPLATNPSQVSIPPPPSAAAFSAINRPSSNIHAFTDTNAVRLMAPTGQIGPSNFPSASQVPNLPGSSSVRPVNLVQPLQNRGLGENQIYDPFSPTAISSVPPKKAETDAEYEDLMASVGVK